MNKLWAWMVAVCLATALVGLGPVAATAETTAASAPTSLPAEQARALADALRDDVARAALIKELERLGAPAADAPTATAETPPKPIGREIAEITRAVAEGAVAHAVRLWAQLQAAPAQLAGLRGNTAVVIWDALVELAATIAVTVAAFVLLRNFGRRIDRAIGARAEKSGLVRTTFLVLGSLLIDAAVVLLAWASGYALTLVVLGDIGTIGIRQTLYLNAFLVVELVKVALRTVLSPTTSALRPIVLPDRAARKLNVWLSVVVSVLGYGQLLVAPIVAEHVSWLAGQAMEVLVALIALFLLTLLVILNRRAVADWFLGARHMASGPEFLSLFARNWHLPALAYLAALFLIVLTRPAGVLLPVLGASGQILAAIVLGSMAASAISRSISRGVSLPPSVNLRLPLLERRLNAFVPAALTALRVVIALAVVGFALETIGVADVEVWLVSQVGVRVTGMIVSVLFMLLIAFGVWLAASSYVDFRLNPDYGSIPSAREQTLLTLGRNALTIVLLAVTTMFVLSEIGIDIAPLIASAGVLGLAIGFGAQKLVQDIITGVFIQFENAMNVGDVVQVGGTTGTVERLTIRSVSLRDVHGVFHIIPFSSVDMVANYMRGFSQYVCDMGVAYRENIDDAKQAMFDAFAELRQTPEWGPFILEDMTWFGLHSFGDSAVILRARIKCAPGKQWAVGRAYNAVVKRIFDERGIEIPFPHQTIFFGEDKRGKAPVAHIAISRERPESGE